MSEPRPTTLVACDLDRTLIYSPRAFWLEGDDADAPGMVVSELYRGEPISFMTRAAETLLQQLRLESVFVPVTTRTIIQYQRVQLPGPTPAYAVTSNGGVLLVDGEPDAAWSASVRRRLAEQSAPIAEVTALLESRAAAAWITKVNNAENLFVYAILDRPAMPDAWLASLEATCRELGWTVSVQGRKLYCVPQSVTKHAAVAEVRRRTGASTVLAAGDSLLDQGMLEAADLAFRPAHGELDEAGFVGGNLTITGSRGILAGEELLRLLGAALGRLG
ncbi:HAD family hydrolase [Subtercola sp. Z020]|uniref:HAD family hydrolase n=1 Tax=Subtercola sp. Z020 TaxID=2080582 RepID=UPI000CE762D5|nr:HAD family hydrolase [Subtercola sp. Z020]PPF75401.1 HAD family hydrolase [Subtercola sp. Z020]